MKYGIPLIVFALLSVAGLGTVPLFDVDEAVFSQATREMMQRGDWITPTYNDAPRYDKPIFFYWFMALSYSIFGVNEFGARFPSALSGGGLVFVLFFFARRILDDARAFRAAVVCALSAFYFAYSHAAVTDMTLTLFIALSLFSFFVWSERGNQGRYLYGLYVFSAFALLTKGLVGILFPFGIAIVYQILFAGARGALGIFSLSGILLFLAIAAPWHIAQYLINGDEFIQQFFVKHHFSRYTGVISGHKGPFYYYLPVLIAGLFPWSAYVVPGIRDTVVRWRGQSRVPDVNLSVFCLIWCVFVVIFFSFSTTKLPNYVLPSLPAFAVLAALGMSAETRWTRISHAVVMLSGFGLAAGCLAGKTYLSGIGIIDDAWVYWCAAALAGMGIAGLSAFFRRDAFVPALAGFMVVFLGVVSLRGLPEAHNYLQGALYHYSILAGRQTALNDKILVYRLNNPSILFYSHRSIINPYDKAGLERAVDGTTGPLLSITKSRDTADLKALGFTLLKDDGRYALLERK